MPSLRRSQEKFSQMLLGSDASSAKPLLVEYGEWADARLAVYRNNVVLSLTEALAANFPAIERLVGKGFFAHAATEFIKNQPPHEAMLSEYGENFPDFLKTFPALSDYPYLPDVARLEYAWLQAYHAPDTPSLNLPDLQKLPPERFGDVRLHLHRHRCFLTSKYPISAIWQANRAPDNTGQEQGHISLDQGPEQILIIRPRLEVEVRTLTPAAYAFVYALDHGRTLTSSYEAAAEIAPDFDLQGALHQFFVGETFTGFDV